MSSQTNVDYFQLDPDNQWLWRANPKRLDAESIRDAMLSMSGNLDLEPPLGSPVATASATSIGRSRSGFDPNRDTPHRSVYLPVVRDQLPRSLELFDFAEPSMVVGKRDVSNTPAQALYLMNNLFTLRQSEAMAKRIRNEARQAKSQMQLAFLYAYGRPATNRELKHAEEYAATLNQGRSGRRRELSVTALANICQGLMLSAEFQTVD